MNDDAIIYELNKICKFDCKFYKGNCISIFFFDTKNIFESTIRHNLNKNKIIKFVTKLQYLQEISLRKARLNFIPEFESSYLKYLDLSCNNLYDCEFIKYYKELKYLNIGSNFITKIPQLPDTLEVLKAHKNFISDYPKIPFNIKGLNLFFNKFQSCPKIDNFHNLEMFCFGVSEIKKLPSLPCNIKHIIMPCNKIESINEITMYKKLETLQLSKNNIKYLPEKIGSLKVKEIYLYRNNINFLPDSFFKLNLNKLNLQENPIFDKNKIANIFSKIRFFQI